MQPASQPPILCVGDNPTMIWGMTSVERIRRIAAKAGLSPADDVCGPAIVADTRWAFDPQWLQFMLARPGSVLTIEGRPVIANTASGSEAARAMALEQCPPDLTEVRAEDHRSFYNKALRKLEWPFLMQLIPANVSEIERRSYYGAYKGVTDLLTKYLWPAWALVLTRVAARIGLTPNMVTAIGAIFNILAMIAFWNGRYWEGMALGLVFMVLDTVDGKLARCTITSSGWGEFFDHGIDIVHPPFWWWAWGVGLGTVGLALPADEFVLIMSALIGGYIVQRLIEGVFIKRFGMDIHVWGRIDSQFRLITARRNPNMVILFAATLVGRPDFGLIAIAWWTVLSCIFHAVRLVQAERTHRRGVPITSWMG
jgi:phosphatidylglycerophosphate synthase